MLLGLAMFLSGCASAPAKLSNSPEVAHLNVRRYLLLDERPFAQDPSRDQADLELLLVQMGGARTTQVSVHVTQRGAAAQVWSNETLSDSIDALDMTADDGTWDRATRFAVVRLHGNKARIQARVGQNAEVSREIDVDGAEARTWMIQIVDGRATIAPCEIR